MCMCFIVFTFLLQGCGNYQSEEDVENMDYKAIAPVLIDRKVMDDEMEIYLDMGDKTKLAYGKYGFYTEVTFDVPVVVTQEIVHDVQYEHVCYGIYQDEGLTKPVAVYEMDKALDSDVAEELNKAHEVYPDRLGVHLDSGTYYFTVYTTESKDDFTMRYECLYGEKLDEYSLTEGEKQYFFPKVEQNTWFTANVNQEGELIVQSDFEGQIRLYNGEKEMIEEATIFDNGQFRYTLEDAGTYYLRIAAYEENYLDDNSLFKTLNPNYIVYTVE